MLFTFLIVEVNKIGDFTSNGVYRTFGDMAANSTDYPLGLLAAFLALNGSQLAWVLPDQPLNEDDYLFNRWASSCSR